jgi:hypothetical protein
MSNGPQQLSIREQFLWSPMVAWVMRRPTYAIRRRESAANVGTYNLSLLCVGIAVAALVLIGSPSSLLVALIITFSTVMALALDKEPLRTKISLRFLPHHVIDYGALVWGFFKDTWPSFVLVLAIYAVAAPLWRAASLGLSAITAFWVLYGTYAGVRLSYLCYSQLTMARRWSSRRSPFLEHAANTADPAAARRHELWAFFWGNVGLVIRCGKQVAFVAAADVVLAPVQPWIHEFTGAWLVAAGLLIAYLCLYATLAEVVFYKFHRTVHENHSLYRGLHMIHHKGVCPSLLDSGTESIAEFSLTEMPVLWLVFPTWAFVAAELGLLGNHMSGHMSRRTAYVPSIRHVIHHHRFSVNYAIEVVLPMDDWFGTACDQTGTE